MTLQHAATRCNTALSDMSFYGKHPAVQHTATHCNTLQRTATEHFTTRILMAGTLLYNTLQNAVTHCNTTLSDTHTAMASTLQCLAC